MSAADSLSREDLSAALRVIKALRAHAERLRDRFPSHSDEVRDEALQDAVALYRAELVILVNLE